MKAIIVFVLLFTTFCDVTGQENDLQENVMNETGPETRHKTNMVAIQMLDSQLDIGMKTQLGDMVSPKVKELVRARVKAYVQARLNVMGMKDGMLKDLIDMRIRWVIEQMMLDIMRQRIAKEMGDRLISEPSASTKEKLANKIVRRIVQEMGIRGKPAGVDMKDIEQLIRSKINDRVKQDLQYMNDGFYMTSDDDDDDSGEKGKPPMRADRPPARRAEPPLSSVSDMMRDHGMNSMMEHMYNVDNRNGYMQVVHGGQMGGGFFPGSQNANMMSPNANMMSQNSIPLSHVIKMMFEAATTPNELTDDASERFMANFIKSLLYKNFTPAMGNVEQVSLESLMQAMVSASGMSQQLQGYVFAKVVAAYQAGQTMGDSQVLDVVQGV